jgi:hypothetical protein
MLDLLTFLQATAIIKSRGFAVEQAFAHPKIGIGAAVAR